MRSIALALLLSQPAEPGPLPRYYAAEAVEIIELNRVWLVEVTDYDAWGLPLPPVPQLERAQWIFWERGPRGWTIVDWRPVRPTGPEHDRMWRQGGRWLLLLYDWSGGALRDISASLLVETDTSYDREQAQRIGWPIPWRGLRDPKAEP